MKEQYEKYTITALLNKLVAECYMNDDVVPQKIIDMADALDEKMTMQVTTENPIQEELPFETSEIPEIPEIPKEIECDGIAYDATDLHMLDQYVLGMKDMAKIIHREIKGILSEPFGLDEEDADPEIGFVIRKEVREPAD